MGGIGCGFSIAAAIFAVIGLIPGLGWVNWFTTLPLSILAIALGIIGLLSSRNRTPAASALVFGFVLFFWAIFRLLIGGGIL